MRAEGYGADIAFDGTTIVVSGKGLGKGALGASAREIRASELSSVDFKSANLLTNGHIDLVVVNGKTRVHFRRKQADEMQAIYQEILRAVPGVAQGRARAPFANVLGDRALEGKAAPRRETADQSLSQTAATPDAPAPPAGHYRRPPHGRPIEPWSAVVTYQNVVGESHYTESFKTLLREYGHTAVSDYGVELTDVRAALVREPDNPYDSDAVAVWVDAKHHVGYLPSGEAARYAPKLDTLDYGTYLLAPGRVWISQDGFGEAYGSVTIQIPDPEGLFPFNDLPDEPFTVLPSGSAIQVQREEDHMDVLRGFGLGSVMRHVAATLHVVEAQKTPRSSKQLLVEVHLDGQRVGTLTKGMSDQVRDLVTYVADLGRLPVARAVVKGSTLRAEVVLYVARTVDVGHRWLDSVASS